MLASAPASRGDLSSRQRSLEQGISSDSGAIGAYQGRLQDLQGRLVQIERSLAIQQALLARIEDELAAARARLAALRAEFARDRQLLAAQLVSQYESPAPDLVDAVLESRGWLASSTRVRM